VTNVNLPLSGLEEWQKPRTLAGIMGGGACATLLSNYV
jgi:hypothetical protein